MSSPRTGECLDSVSISHRKERVTPSAVMLVCPSGLDISTTRASSSAPSSHARGNVIGFSKKSKARLRKRLMRVDFDALDSGGKRARAGVGWFVTLTYPRKYDTEWHKWKRDLDAWGKRLRRLCGFRWAIWKLELQQRGAPHFHIVVAFDHAVAKEDIKRWVMSSWHECVGTDDTQHLFVGTDVRPLYNPRHNKLMSYLLKYLGKTDAPGQERPTGRIWGIWGTMPDGVIMTVRFHRREDWTEFIRRVRKWGRQSRYLRRRTATQGLSIIGRGVDLFHLCKGLSISVIPGLGWSEL